jgi:APA family basic amino acid/polyamine antiporter
MAISGMALVDDVRITWTFSAFAVLLYYAITNLAALRLTPELRRFPRWVSIAGLASCAFLSFWVPVGVWLTGVAVTAAGLLWRLFWRRRAAVTDP